MSTGSEPTSKQMWEYLEAHLHRDTIHDLINAKKGTGYGWNVKNGFSDMGSEKEARLRDVYDLVFGWYGHDLFIDAPDPGHREPLDMKTTERSRESHRMTEDVLGNGKWTESKLAVAIGYETVGGLKTFRKNPSQNMSCRKYRKLRDIHKAL